MNEGPNLRPALGDVVDAYLDAPMDVISPPVVSPDELHLITGVKIPCPGDDDKQCDSAKLLNKKHKGTHAHWVEGYLDFIEESERNIGQENNLGCALAWLNKWRAARNSFARAEKKNGKSDERDKARKNQAIAERALP